MFAFVNKVNLDKLNLPLDITGYTATVRFNDMLNTAREVVPNLKQVVLLGDHLDTQVAYRHFKYEIPLAAKDVEVIDLTGIPMRELKKRVTNLPARAAIIYTSIYSDGEGTFYPPVEALRSWPRSQIGQS